MKKFKSSIEISMENVRDVLNCPIVGGIQKKTSSVYIEGRGTKPYFTKLVVDITGFDFPFTINCGSVLALDICVHGMLLQKRNGINIKMTRYDKEEKSWIF